MNFYTADTEETAPNGLPDQNISKMDLNLSSLLY